MTPVTRRTAAAQFSVRPHLARSLIFTLLGLTLILGSSIADLHLHRGVIAQTAGEVRHPVGHELAVNVDLRLFSGEGLDQVTTFIRDGGYRFVRQEFSWSDIQPSQGELDWTVYRAIVDAAARADLTVIAILASTPVWARASDRTEFTDAPPRSTAFFATFCRELRAQFPDLQFFQVGTALDDPDRWGGRLPNSDEYGALLSIASEELRILSTDSYLISAELGSTLESRATGLDLQIIETVLATPRVRGLVDVIALAADGGSASPYDRRVDPARLNLSRVVAVREALANADLDDYPVWLTHFGWSGGPDHTISPEEQAEFVEAGLRRARLEWAWAGVITVWSFVASPGEEMASLALVSGQSPTPLYRAVQGFASTTLGASAPVGFSPPSTSACQFRGAWPEQNLNRRLSFVSRDTTGEAECAFWGTSVQLVTRYSPASGEALVRVDGAPIDGWEVRDGWSVIPLTFRGAEPLDVPILLADGLSSGPHTLTIRVGGTGEVVFGGIIVQRVRTNVWPISLLLIVGIASLAVALHGLMTVVARYTGRLRPEGLMLHPPLPRLPDWQPTAARRVR